LLSIFLLPVTRLPGLMAYVEPAKELLSGVVLLWWARHQIFWQGRSGFLRSLGIHPLHGWIMAFGAWTLVTAAASAYPGTSLHAAFVQIEVLAYFYVFADTLRDGRFFRRALLAFMAGAALAAAVGVIQHLIVHWRLLPSLERYAIPLSYRFFLQTGREDLLAGGAFRSMGTLFHPNFLGAYLAFFLPFVTVLFFNSIRRTERFFLGLMALLFVAGLYCANSRGAWLNAAVSMSVAGFFLRDRIRKQWLACLAAPAVMAGMLFPAQIHAYFRLDEGLSGREIIWRNAFEMLERSPWTGIGPGVFSREYVLRYGFPSLHDLYNVLNEIFHTGQEGIFNAFTAHDLFLNAAVETGLPGAFLILLFYCLCLAMIIRYFRWRPVVPPQGRLIAVAAAAALFGNFVHAFFEASVGFSLLFMGIPLVFVVSAGIMVMNRTCET
jgi:O-antigen ligase